MIGVYGGTFDPVHYGHLRTALEVKELFSLNEVRLIPCKTPPHRAQPMASPKMRLQMLHLAVEAESGLVVDTGCSNIGGRGSKYFLGVPGREFRIGRDHQRERSGEHGPGKRISRQAGLLDSAIRHEDRQPRVKGTEVGFLHESVSIVLRLPLNRPLTGERSSF